MSGIAHGYPAYGNTAEAVDAAPTAFIAKFLIAYISLYTALMAPVAITLAIRIESIDPTGKGASLGTILGFGALCALIANPLFGQLSDRTRSRFGRRKPWLVGGVLIGAVAIGVISISTNLVVVGIAWCVAQTAYNAALATLTAVVPDQIPEQQRGKVSAFSGMALYIALLIASGIVWVIGTAGASMFMLPAILGAVGVCVFAFGLSDRSAATLDQQPSGNLLGEFAASFWVNPVRHKDFAWAWLSRFFVFLGVSVLLTYQVYYLSDHLGYPSDKIGQMMLISTLVTTVCVTISSYVSGWLSDHFRRRKIFVLTAAVVYAVGIAIIVASPGIVGFLAGVAVSSIGFGVYMAVDQALVVDVLPDRETHAAKNMGVFNIANAVPQSIAPAVAPILLAIGSTTNANYPLLYAAAAACAFVGALAIIPVRGVR